MFEDDGSADEEDSEDIEEEIRKNFKKKRGSSSSDGDGIDFGDIKEPNKNKKAW